MKSFIVFILISHICSQSSLPKKVIEKAKIFLSEDKRSHINSLEASTTQLVNGTKEKLKDQLKKI